MRCTRRALRQTEHQLMETPSFTRHSLHVSTLQASVSPRWRTLAQDLWNANVGKSWLGHLIAMQKDQCIKTDEGEPAYELTEGSPCYLVARNGQSSQWQSKKV